VTSGVAEYDIVPEEVCEKEPVAVKEIVDVPVKETVLVLVLVLEPDTAIDGETVVATIHV
jgi:hypothetical protein